MSHPGEAKFALDATVEWSSQAAGVRKFKSGRVVAIVPPGLRPGDHHLPRVTGSGFGRKEISYIVRAGGRLYWPRTSLLRLAGGASS